MSSWAQSRPVTQRCWGLVKENRYFLAFPLIGFAVGLVFIVVLGGAGALLLAGDGEYSGLWWAGAVLIVLMLYLASLATQFCMAGLVAAADEELHGRQSSVGAGFAVAGKHIGVIAVWTALSTIFGLLMQFIQQKAGVVGDIVSVIGGVAWNLITFFVLPFMILEGDAPISAIKHSGSLFKQRWGMRVAGGVRIGGIIFLLAFLPAMVALVFGIALSMSGGAAIGIPLAIIGFIVFFAAQLLLATLRGVFSVALYRYASGDEVLGGFEAAQLQSAVRVKA